MQYVSDEESRRGQGEELYLRVCAPRGRLLGLATVVLGHGDEYGWFAEDDEAGRRKGDKGNAYFIPFHPGPSQKFHARDRPSEL